MYRAPTREERTGRNRKMARGTRRYSGFLDQGGATPVMRA